MPCDRKAFYLISCWREPNFWTRSDDDEGVKKVALDAGWRKTEKEKKNIVAGPCFIFLLQTLLV